MREMFFVCDSGSIPAAREVGHACGLEFLSERLSHFSFHSNEGIVSNLAGVAVFGTVVFGPACACGAPKGNDGVDVGGAGCNGVEILFFRYCACDTVEKILLREFESLLGKLRLLRS